MHRQHPESSGVQAARRQLSSTSRSQVRVYSESHAFSVKETRVSSDSGVLPFTTRASRSFSVRRLDFSGLTYRRACVKEKVELHDVVYGASTKGCCIA